MKKWITENIKETDIVFIKNNGLLCFNTVFLIGHGIFTLISYKLFINGVWVQDDPTKQYAHNFAWLWLILCGILSIFWLIGFFTACICRFKKRRISHVIAYVFWVVFIVCYAIIIFFYCSDYPDIEVFYLNQLFFLLGIIFVLLLFPAIVVSSIIFFRKIKNIVK
ncbi:MAG: hypothetical protein FWF56_00945 [Firmicutes bacterium]|nr:hypothetical protein [Bacillota bacterium]MCL1953363.1 hypothetical protein [Bacillota bacterium]